MDNNKDNKNQTDVIMAQRITIFRSISEFFADDKTFLQRIITTKPKIMAKANSVRLIIVSISIRYKYVCPEIEPFPKIIMKV